MKSLSGVEYRNIIVRMPNWIGDMVMATPILTDLRKRFPNSRITTMCRSPVCDLLKEDADIDELFCFSKTKSFSRRSERKNMIDKLRHGKYDLGILLTHSFSSAWWFWQGSVKNRLGYDCNGRRFFLTCPVPLPENVEKQHLVYTYKNLLRPLGIEPSNSPPRLYLSGKEVESAIMLLQQHGITKETTLIGINPGATYGSAKCWLPDRFRTVAQKLLLDPKVSIVFLVISRLSPLLKRFVEAWVHVL
jgi:heptosyltransferase II